MMRSMKFWTERRRQASKAGGRKGSGQAKLRGRRAGYGARLAVETLEDRLVLSAAPVLNVVVDPVVDEGSPLVVSATFTDVVEGSTGGGGAIGIQVADHAANAAANGAFDPAANVFIDTDTLTISGGFSGVGTTVQADIGHGSFEVAVFAFSDFELDFGITLTASGSRPLALLSQSDIVIGGVIDVSAQGGFVQPNAEWIAGPGGGNGGFSDGVNRQNGSPAAGAPANSVGVWTSGAGSGGGFGGDGGRAENNAGATTGIFGHKFADLAQSIQGGSGGATTGTFFTILAGGGGGGGGIELGAADTITITATGTVLADGGDGRSASATTGNGGGGGGAGGGILLHATNVYQHGLLSARGGNGGAAPRDGGGGGGGAILIAHDAAGVFDNTGGVQDVAGGGNGVGSGGEDGHVGVVDIVPVAPVAVPVMETFTFEIDWDDLSPVAAGSATIDVPGVNIGDTVHGSFGASYTYQDNGLFLIAVTISDDNGGTTTQEFEVLVNNVAPTATLSNGGPVEEGSPASVFFSGQHDPSTADTTAGFRYAYDFDNDGIWDVGDGTYAGSVTSDSETVPSSFIPDGTASYTVKARILDKDGGFNDYTTDVQVDNVAPTPVIDAISAVRLEGTEIIVTASATDPAGANDTLIFEYAVYRDGSTTAAFSDSGVDLTSFTFTPADNGSYEIVLMVSDEDGGSTSVSQTIAVDNVAPTPVIDAISAVRLEGTEIIVTASATDPAGANDTLTFEYAVYKDGSTTAAFSDSGVDLTSFAFTPADNGSYEIVLTVSDEDGGSTSDSQTIGVDNVAPTLDAASFQVVEHSADGTVVGSVTASDPGDDTISFSIIGGTGAAAFAIDAVSGEITVADGTLLDYETAATLTILVEATDDDGDSTTELITIEVIKLPSIHGVVYVDINENGQFDANEPGIEGVVIRLLDGSGNTVLDDQGDPVVAVTTSGGYYLFDHLNPGVYQIWQVQPSGVTDGAEQLGSLGGAIVANDRMQLTLTDTDAYDYVFAEIGQQLASGDAAGIGFWQNKHGQQLITLGGTHLANWLTSTFSNVFGNTLAGASGTQVSHFYRDQLFKQQSKKPAGPAKVDAQFMAVALATYFTSRTLALSDVASSYGFQVTDTGIGTKIVNVGNKGAAFGIANHSDLTILQLLKATDSLTDQPDNRAGFAAIYDIDGDGVISSAEASLRTMANEIFTSINESGGI